MLSSPVNDAEEKGILLSFTETKPLAKVIPMTEETPQGKLEKTARKIAASFELIGSPISMSVSRKVEDHIVLYDRVIEILAEEGYGSSKEENETGKRFHYEFCTTRPGAKPE